MFKFLNALLDDPRSFPLDYISGEELSKRKRAKQNRRSILKNVVAQIIKEKRKEKRKPKLEEILKQAHEEDDKELAWEKIMKLYNKTEYKKQDCMKELDTGLRYLRKIKIGLKRMKSDLE